MKPFYNKPRMTQNGLTFVTPYNNARGTADERVQQVLEFMRTHTMTPSTHVHEWRPAEFWEFMYVTDGGMRGAGGRTFKQRWEDFCKIRTDRAGYYTLAGNFEEYSFGFDILTRDPRLVSTFLELMAANPGARASLAYHAETDAKFEQLKNRYGVDYDERYCPTYQTVHAVGVR